MDASAAAARSFRLVKFEHSIFALPFAAASVLIATSGYPPLVPTLLILAACVFARTSAMSFNRFADAGIDAANPRTQNREIPKGLLTKKFALGLCILSAALFAGSCALLNLTVLILSPVALITVIGYSYTKRFTALSHIVLGVSLSLAPMGAWLALGGEFSLIPVFLSLAVVFWTAGFDVIYSCQDFEFDRDAGLKSIPASLGIGRALLVSKIFHAAAIAFLTALFFEIRGFGVIYLATVFVVGILLVWEHQLVAPNDLSNLNTAFFTANGFIGIVFAAGVAADIYIGAP